MWSTVATQQKNESHPDCRYCKEQFKNKTDETVIKIKKKM